MAITGINSAPQPDNCNNDNNRCQEELKEHAKSIFDHLNKNKDNVINEEDGIDSSMLAAFKKLIGENLNLDNFIKNAEKLLNFKYTKAGNYNGVKAQITYNLHGNIKSVNTGARDKEEAIQQMGLDKIHIVKESDGSGWKDVSTYGREYKKGNGTEKEYFVWNEKTKSMDFYWGGWSQN